MTNETIEQRRAKKRRAYLRGLESEAGRSKPAACEVCGTADRRGVVWDHDHFTGKFRGWLCFKCNSALGLIGDDPRTLRALALYLDRAFKAQFPDALKELMRYLEEHPDEIDEGIEDLQALKMRLQRPA